MEGAGRAAWLHLLPIQWQAGEDAGTDARVEAAVGLLHGTDRPTAVIAYEMTEAMAIVRAALTLGLRIPADLSLIQFHHRAEDRFFLPIHTVSNMMREVGEGAAAMLMEKVACPDGPLPAKAIPEVLLKGATCAPPGRY